MLKRLLPVLPFLLFVACAPDLSNPAIQNAVIQTMTATAWTPTPSPTPAPNTGRIVELLNNVMLGADPLAETIEAKFSVIDVQFLLDGLSGEMRNMRISVDCEWIFSNSCTPENSFVMLMHAFGANNHIMERIVPQVPLTVQEVQVAAFDRMSPAGLILVKWSDILEYAAGRINGSQLGSRISRPGQTP
jgi:hypothetical protein